MTQSLKLGDALDVLIDHRGKTPKKLGGEWCSDGHRVVSALNLKDNRVDSNDHHYVDDDLYQKWMKIPLRAGDVLLTSEAPLGEVAYLEADVDWCLGQRLFALRAKPCVLDGRYLYYLLRGGPVRNQILSRASGSTVSGIRQAELVQVDLVLPSVGEQRAISATLGALDGRIDSNRRQMELLAQLISARFRLIVQDATDTLPLSLITSLTKGVSYRSLDLRESRTSLVTLKSFDRTGGYKPSGLKPFAGKYKPAQRILPGELAVAQTDLTQGAEVVGRAIRIPASRAADILVASLDLVIVRPTDGIPVEFLFGVLTDERFREHCRSRTNGTTVLHLAADAMPEYEAPDVSRTEQIRFAEEVRPFFVKIDSLEREQEHLVALRDLLIPELISGEVRVVETPVACGALT